ncbi:MAG: dipeptidase [Anaerolineae bacterium]
MFIVDAHLDLAYNALNNGRDLRLPVPEIRQREGKKPASGLATVSLPDLRAAGVGLVFGSLFVMPAHAQEGALAGEIVYRDAAEAHRHALVQLDYYHRLADEEPYVRLVGSSRDLEAVVASHQPGGEPLLGILPLMEGADPIRRPEEVAFWYERGLRVIGLAWDDTRYASGAWRATRSGVSRGGLALLERMAELGMILDLTHLSEPGCYEALDRYEGPVAATHCNTRRIVPGQRQLPDPLIRALGERDGVIGVVLYNRFLRPHHMKGDAKELVTLDHVVAHIDHICQLLGDAGHVGIGSDFDGGFGAADIPAEMDGVKDLSLIAARLAERGYGPDDVANVMGGNWVRLLRRTLA